MVSLVILIAHLEKCYSAFDSTIDQFYLHI
jgi:hypothetical protein